MKEEHEIRRKLINTCAELKADPINKSSSINYDFVWEDGLPVNAIKKAVNERNIQLVVMGSHGENREKFHGIYLESNAAAIIEEVSCPVFVVPFNGNSFEGIKRVVYALDIMNFKFDTITGAINLLKSYHPDIAFVYFTEEADSKVENRYELAKTAILENVLYKNISFELLTASHLVNGLNSYAERNGADLIVMATYKKSFLEKFFDKSQAKKMLYKLKNPVLIMHVG
ncbi:MAG: universal stress protein [Cytophagaceae bacterium]